MRAFFDEDPGGKIFEYARRPLARDRCSRYADADWLNALVGYVERNGADVVYARDEYGWTPLMRILNIEDSYWGQGFFRGRPILDGVIPVAAAYLIGKGADICAHARDKSITDLIAFEMSGSSTRIECGLKTALCFGAPRSIEYAKDGHVRSLISSWDDSSSLYLEQELKAYRLLLEKVMGDIGALKEEYARQLSRDTMKKTAELYIRDGDFCVNIRRADSLHAPVLSWVTEIIEAT